MAYLKIITGPMFSGKTEELIRILHRSQIAGKTVLVIKPRLDTRTKNEIASRKKPNAEASVFQKFMDFPAFPISNHDELKNLLEEHQPDVLGLDEAQFFDLWIFDAVQELLRERASSDFMILAAGLDMDAWGKPFGPMPRLLSIADNVQKETAICFVCKGPAMITQKLVDTGKTVEVGDAEIYEARCRVCHTLPESESAKQNLSEETIAEKVNEPIGQSFAGLRSN